MIWSRVKCLNQSIKRGKSSESNYSLGNQFCLQTFQRHEKIVLLSDLIFLDDIVYQLLSNQKEYSLEEVSFIFLEN